MPITIRDVAKAAGVSITTVSRALNGYPDVSVETRSKIVHIAETLNYRPSSVARSLVMNRTRTIGLLVSDLSKGRTGHYFMFQVLYGLHDRLAELGYDLILFSTTSKRQQQISYLDFCTERRLDGVCVMGIRLDDPYIHEVVESSLPSVVIDLPLLSDTCGYVMTDNVYGARLAVRHLLSRDHKNIAFINGHSQAAVSRDRKRGYEEALREADLPVDESLQRHADYTADGGAKAFEDVYKQNRSITAAFFASDLMALGALAWCKTQGIAIPDDVAFVGFDDIELAQFSSPPLTTILQRRYEMGVTAANMVVAMTEGTDMAQGRMLAPELIIRQST